MKGFLSFIAINLLIFGFMGAELPDASGEILIVLGIVLFLVVIVIYVKERQDKAKLLDKAEEEKRRKEIDKEVRETLSQQRKKEFYEFVDNLPPSRKELYNKYRNKTHETISDYSDEEIDFLLSHSTLSYIRPGGYNLEKERIKRRKKKKKDKAELLVEREKKHVIVSIAGKLIEKSICKVDNQQNYPGVYLIVNNKTLDFYIGESQNISFRRKTHIGEMAAGEHHRPLMQEHYYQYGVSAFDFYILRKVNDDTENGTARKEIEVFYIEEYNPTYN